MKKIISMILAMLMMLSCADAAPFVQLYDEMQEQSETLKVIAEGDYVFALSKNSEIYVYDISNKNNIDCIKTIYREGFTVKDLAIAQKKLIITYDSETESHVTSINIANIHAWYGKFTDYTQVTAAKCEIEVADKYIYFKSYAENKVYVCDWVRGIMRYKGELGEEYINMTTSGKYMYIPEDDVTKVYDVSSTYSGTEVAQIPLTEITKAVICGEYIIIAKGNEAKVFTSDFTEIYSYNAHGMIADMEISGENLWIAASNEIQMLSTADIATELTLKSKATVSKQDDIAAIGEYAFATAQAGIKVHRNLPYEITDAQYTSENGEVIYSANFENYTESDIPAEIYMLVLKDGKTVKTVKDTLNFAANSQTPVTASVQADKGCEIRTIIIDSLSSLDVLSTEYANERIVSYIKTNKSDTQKFEYEGTESIEISDTDEYGNVTICGVSAAKEGRELAIAVKYGDAVTYMNATVAGDESYGFAVKPSGYGTHEVIVNDGGIIYSGSFEVAAPKIEVVDLWVDVGRETYIIIKAQNMQNAEKVQLEMDYNEAALEFEAVPEMVSIMEGFEAENVSAADGTLSITLNKTDKITTAEAEFLKIAIKTSANEGTYALAPDIQITDALGNTAVAQVTDGTLEIDAAVGRYDAIEAATEVLRNVKPDFDKAEYRTQKLIVADANAKIEYALSKGVREYEFNSTLMQNLKSAEAVLAEYKAEFDAIDAINAAAAVDIDAEIAKYVKVLNINTALWNIYTESGIDKTDIQTKLEACVFDLPENTNNQLADIIILGLIEKTQWSGMDKIITDLGDAFGFSDSRYKDLSSSARQNVAEAIAEKTFADIPALGEALKTAVDTYYTTMTWVDNVDLPESYAYSFAVVGDTQKIAYNYPQYMTGIYDWIVENADENKLKFVFGLGDITDENTNAEWALAKAAIRELDDVVPYSLVRGNHDMVKEYTTYFPYSEFASRISGTYDGTMLNTYQYLTVNGIKYLIFGLDYGASDSVLNWASGIIEQNSDCNVIITTHAYLFRDGTTIDSGDVCPPSISGGHNNGDAIWDKLIKKHENIVLVLSGHDPWDNIILAQDKGENGNIVSQLLIDPQGVDNELEGCGLVAMLYFSEDGKKVDVRYYSTVKKKYFMHENQFSFDINVIKSDSVIPVAPSTEINDISFNVSLTADEYSGKIFAALYDESGKITSIRAYDAAENIPVSFDKSAVATQIKVFWWNGVDTIVPVCLPEVIDVIN